VTDAKRRSKRSYIDVLNRRTNLPKPDQCKLQGPGGRFAATIGVVSDSSLAPESLYDRITEAAKTNLGLSTLHKRLVRQAHWRSLSVAATIVGYLRFQLELLRYGDSCAASCWTGVLVSLGGGGGGCCCLDCCRCCAVATS